MHWLAEQSLLIGFTAACVAGFAVQYGWLRKIKCTRWPWFTWIAAAVLVGVGWRIANHAGAAERKHIESITQDFARLYGDEMEKRGHWELPTKAAENDPFYLDLIDTEKTWLAMNPDVHDIYTLRKLPNGQIIFIVDSETDYNRNGQFDEVREQRTPMGEVYKTADEGVQRAFRGEPNFYFAPVTDRWGTWVNAFVPLHDPMGDVEGVLGVDFDAQPLAAAIAHAKLRVIGLLALMQLVLLGSSTLTALRRAQIEERKRDEESLRLLGAAVEQTRESVIITDATLDLPGPKILFVNPAFTRMTGFSSEDVLGETPRILQGARTDRAVLDRLRHALSRGEVFRGEIINYRKDGTEFLLEWQVAPIRNPGGTITHYVAIQRDISERKQAEVQSFELPRGTETVLLVEDDAAQLDMASALLRQLGYTALTAASGAEALKLTERRTSEPIDLLFTDVVMPQMNGRELSERVRSLRPETKVLFTSGYSAPAASEDRPGQSSMFLQKPFTAPDLARKVREILDAHEAQSAGGTPKAQKKL